MNKLGINLWNWAPGAVRRLLRSADQGSRNGFTAAGAADDAARRKPDLRDEVRGSGLEVSLCAAMGQGAIFRALTPMWRAATMQ